MGILVIDSKPENLEYYKGIIGVEGNHFVAGLNDSLMLLETVYEFDLAICSYKLDDATGKDLHENFRMLPETEKVPIIFILDVPDSSIENAIKKMSLTEVLISPDDDELNQKIQSIISKDDYEVSGDIDDFSDEGVTAITNNQVDFDSLMNEVETDTVTDNQVDFDALMNEVDNDDTEDDNQVDFDSLMNEVSSITQKPDLSSSNYVTELDKLTKDNVFSGNIKTTPFVDILLHILEKNYTAKIILKNEFSEEECEIKIEDKYITQIEMEDFDIDDTLFWVLNWDIASVEISLIDNIPEKNCEIPIEEIIEDVINKRTEFEELSETLPDLETILIPTSTYDSTLSDFEDEYKKTIELFDGANSINDVLSLIEEDNIYTLTIISQLYMDEILILPEENKIKQESLVPENYNEPKSEDEDEDEDDLLSTYLTEEENEDYGEEDDDLSINTEILESDDNFEELNKEKYIEDLIESFKEDEEIIIKPEPSPFKTALFALFFINLVLTIFIFAYKKKPQKIVINNIKTQKNIIKKVELYHLGLNNKVHYVKNKIDIVNEVLKQKIFKQKRKIVYENILKNEKYGTMIKKADFYVLKGNYKKAISIYKKILEKVPSEASILLKLATAYYNNEDNENSMKIVEKLDFLKNNELNFIFLKAQIYQSNNDLKNALEYYSKFLERSEDIKLKEDVRVIVNSLSKKVKIVRNRP